MDPKRQGEIALKIVKYLIQKKGIKLSQDSMIEYKEFAKEIDVPFEELKQVAKPIVQNLLEEIFSMK